ncbi:hypothetical protein MKW98_015481 [Papaver atlanticum]|uniref:Uncharacterized protein n=1 Tax=Papaver atlanticum TaxID=357466 RepID=A0AAD4RZB0_9MAGN|nr:hypothetical protein MKW98_015481 [Papaver atlanticum]
MNISQPDLKSQIEEAKTGGGAIKITQRSKISSSNIGRMNWIQRKILLYNVTFGLYMLDWWERYLFNIMIVVLLWFVCYNGSRSAAEFYTSHLKVKLGMEGLHLNNLIGHQKNG